MDDPYNLERFVTAQNAGGTYEHAIEELRRGHKTSHWMWFVFPQIAGLGQSQTSRTYALASLEEAKAYLRHPLLGPRLIECAGIVASARAGTAEQIFGDVDTQKLRSSMTLFINWPGWRPSPLGDGGKPIRAQHGRTCPGSRISSTIRALLKAPGDGLKQFPEFALLQPRMFQRFRRVIVRWVKTFHVHRPRAGVTCPGRYTCSGRAACQAAYRRGCGVQHVKAFSDKLPPLGGSHLTRAKPTEALFSQVLDRYFEGAPDSATDQRV